jgi:hypothetical protein
MAEDSYTISVYPVSEDHPAYYIFNSFVDALNESINVPASADIDFAPIADNFIEFLERDIGMKWYSELPIIWKLIIGLALHANMNNIYIHCLTIYFVPINTARFRCPSLYKKLMEDDYIGLVDIKNKTDMSGLVYNLLNDLIKYKDPWETKDDLPNTIRQKFIDVTKMFINAVTKMEEVSKYVISNSKSYKYINLIKSSLFDVKHKITQICANAKVTLIHVSVLSEGNAYMFGNHNGNFTDLFGNKIQMTKKELLKYIRKYNLRDLPVNIVPKLLDNIDEGIQVYDFAKTLEDFTMKGIKFTVKEVFYNTVIYNVTKSSNYVLYIDMNTQTANILNLPALTKVKTNIETPIAVIISYFDQIKKIVS